MSLISDIFAKVLTPPTEPATPATAPTTGSAPAADTGSSTAATSDTSAPSATPAQTVDVAANLDGLAAKSSQKLSWRQSIVDLLGLLGMDTSLSTRKHLATELGYTGDESDSATMNVWLHKQVMKKLADNGGKVPADLLT